MKKLFVEAYWLDEEKCSSLMVMRRVLCELIRRVDGKYMVPYKEIGGFFPLDEAKRIVEKAWGIISVEVVEVDGNCNHSLTESKAFPHSQWINPPVLVVKGGKQ